jgi:hypothetical protein
MTTTTLPPPITITASGRTLEWQVGEWWGPTLTARGELDGTYTVTLSPHADMDLRGVAEGVSLAGLDALVTEWMAATAAESTEAAVARTLEWLAAR